MTVVSADNPYRYVVDISVREPILRSDAIGLHSPDITIDNLYTGDGMSNEFYLTSEHLDELSDPVQVWARGFALSLLYVGAYNLTHNADTGNWTWVGTGRILALYEADRWPSPISLDRVSDIAPGEPFSQAILNRPPSVTDHPPYGLVAQLLYAARSQEDIRILLLQLGYGLDWINLYAILDTLEYYTKQPDATHYKTVLNWAGLSENDVKAFTGMANNFGLLGVLARHGQNKPGVPKRQITLGEAKQIIIRFVKAYLHYKHGFDTGPMASEYDSTSLRLKWKHEASSPNENP